MARIKWVAKDIDVVKNLLSEQECLDYITLSENKGFRDAPVSTETGMMLMKGVRNND